MKDNTEYIIVYGPPGSGKSINSIALKQHFQCDHVFDDWYNLEAQLEGVTGRVLILSHEAEVFDAKRRRKLFEPAACYSVDQAMALLGERWTVAVEGFSPAREHAKMLERAGVKTAHDLGRELLAGPDFPIFHFDPSRAGLDDESDTSLSFPRIQTQSHADGLSAEEIEDMEEEGVYMGKFLTIVGDTDEAGEGANKPASIDVTATTVSALAGELYEEYCRWVGGKAFNGDPLPSWEAFSADPKKDLQRVAWIAVALQAERKLGALRREIRRDEDEDTAAERKVLSQAGANSVQAAAAERDEAAGRTVPGVD